MSESWTHLQAKLRSAGRGGFVEVPLSRNRRLDALSRDGNWATEVELSGNFSRLMRAAWRLKDAPAQQKVLKVHEDQMEMAAAALRRVEVSAWVRNIDGSREFFVKVRR
jgi:hypothetical protein